MINELFTQIKKAKSINEILACKKQIVTAYNIAYENLKDQPLMKTNYEDIKALHDLHLPMMAYYGPSFYSDCGIPFLKEHNPTTLEIIELTILFYSMQIYEILEKGYFYDEINKIMKEDNQNLFWKIWHLFAEVITLRDDSREITVTWDNKIVEIYLDDEKYENVLDLTYNNYTCSEYFHIIERIIGIYNLRFTKMKYILEYQPLFVEVGFRYLSTII